MQVGEVYRVRTDSVYCLDNRPNYRPRVAGTVLWVHPKGRFAVLDIGGMRECYYPEELTKRLTKEKKKARRVRIVC